ncbi:hypothetical protein F383_16668 [Gossypium arboreum]|uniref:Uncharacterized protein n=1 Tax=Gossypium arboreum TaxID=29729 RepID=A0A0B0NH28_GOSAR|nr:hypothetical protein F383_16668 [Gossypium arboreum]
MKLGSRSGEKNSMARERAYMCYEIEVAEATYVTPCVQRFPEYPCHQASSD